MSETEHDASLRQAVEAEDAAMQAKESELIEVSPTAKMRSISDVLAIVKREADDYNIRCNNEPGDWDNPTREAEPFIDLYHEIEALRINEPTRPKEDRQ